MGSKITADVLVDWGFTLPKNSLTVKSHIPELDGIRGLAILMVLIWHYVTCQESVATNSPITYVIGMTGLFWSGVDLFFVLSGFLIGGILLDNSQKQRFYRSFYIRRAVRIIPVYTLLLLAFFVCRHLIDRQKYAWLFSDKIPDLAYLSFTQNIFMGLHNDFGGNFLGITWSLSIEEQFYLFIPILLFFVGPSRFIKFVILLAISAPLLRLAFPGFHAFVNTPFRMDSLLMGVLLAAIFRSEHALCTLNKNKSTLWGVFTILLFWMGGMTVRNLGQTFLEPTAIALFYTVFIALSLIYQGQRETVFLRLPILMRLGRYSYGLYMYHQMVAGLMHGYLRGDAPSLSTGYGAIVTLISIIVTIALAVISHHTIESYFLSLGRRYTYE